MKDAYSMKELSVSTYFDSAFLAMLKLLFRIQSILQMQVFHIFHIFAIAPCFTNSFGSQHQDSCSGILEM